MDASRPAQKQLAPVRETVRFVSLRNILALILREMTSTYGRSPGGYVWTVLEPALGIALLSLVFSLGFKTPPLGDNFPIFYATGLLPFSMFSVASNKMAQAINYSKALLNYPRVTFMDTLISRMVLTVTTNLMVGFILLFAITMAWETRTVLELDRAILAYSMAIALGVGVGTLNCFLITMFPLWQMIWGILMRPMFVLSGVILLLENIPTPYSDYLWFNPVIHATGEMRGAFFLQYEAKYVSPAYVFGVAAVSLLLGLLFLRRYHRDMLEL